MVRPLRSRLTYANVIATLALFVALGGASYARFAVPQNSVGTAQLKNGAVTPPKVASSTQALLKGARAYAFVTFKEPSNQPVLDRSRTKNFVAVRRMFPNSSGLFCLKLASGINAAGTAPVVSAGYATGDAGVALGADVDPFIDPSDCTRPGEIGVFTYGLSSTGAVPEDAVFFIAVP